MFNLFFFPKQNAPQTNSGVPADSVFRPMLSATKYTTAWIILMRLTAQVRWDIGKLGNTKQGFYVVAAAAIIV